MSKPTNEQSPESSNTTPSEPENEDDQSSNRLQLQMAINEIVDGMNSEETEVQYIALQMSRKMMYHDHKQAIEIMIERGIINLFIDFLLKFDKPAAQFEAAWTITNMIISANTEQILHIIDNDAIPNLLILLKSKNEHLVLQALWSLGNIAGAGSFMRDVVLKYNVIDILIKLINKDTSILCLRNIIWLMSNLCRSTNTAPTFNEIKSLIPVLTQVLISTDVEVLTNACWGFAFLTIEEHVKIQAVIDAGAVPRLVGLLYKDELEIIVPALKTIGNIVAGTDLQTDCVIAAGGLAKFMHLFENDNEQVVEEVAWIVSNIAAGNKEHKQALCASGIFFKIHNLLDTGEFNAQKEAALAVTNIIVTGSLNQIHDLVIKFMILIPYIEFLDVKNEITIEIVLNGLTRLFALPANKMGGIGYLQKIVEKAGGLDKFEILKQHKDERINKMAKSIVDKYFANKIN